MTLNDGGARVGNTSIQLFAMTADHFKLVSEKDCVDIDPVHARMTTCPIRTTGCQALPGETFIGRFDWMNGFDPPHARFTLRFRYLPSYEMVCPV